MTIDDYLKESARIQDRAHRKRQQIAGVWNPRGSNKHVQPLIDELDEIIDELTALERDFASQI